MSVVNIIGITKPSAYTGCSTANELVAWTARVSNPSNQNNTKTASKLVQYLIKNEHWSPLEMVHISMEIRTTRDIARQILRHRSFSFQEFSQRYADPTTDLGFYHREARLQDDKNRQNSVEVNDPRLHEDWNMKQQEGCLSLGFRARDCERATPSCSSGRQHRIGNHHGRITALLGSLLHASSWQWDSEGTC
mgnify:CR=1 FL=1